jgi:protoporphyrinogen oxidase
MIHKHILILGSGPCGLGAAWRLRELGITDYQVLESGSYPGGLAASFVDQKGFTWDIGGHVLHSHYPYFDRVFETVMHGEYFTHQRESWVWIANRFVPYPFQNNIHRLPSKMRNDCLTGLKSRTEKDTKLKTFTDWIYASYGRGIADIFLLPYNEKVWAYPLVRMSSSWVGDRVAPVDIARIEENIRMNRDDTGWGPNSIFHFPKHGGTGELWSRIAGTISKNILYRKKVVHIDTKAKTVHCSDGSVFSYNVLLSTMPLTTLVSMLDDQEDIPAVSLLHASTVTVVGFGIKGKTPSHLSSKCWIYFPQLDIPFFRATIFSNYSPLNAPSGHWSLMTEVASSKYRPLPLGDIINRCIKGAVKAKLIDDESAIVDTFSYTANSGYPTPTLERDSIVDPTIAKLEKYTIYSRGRFGLWKYEISNQDHSFMQGVEWADRIV